MALIGSGIAITRRRIPTHQLIRAAARPLPSRSRSPGGRCRIFPVSVAIPPDRLTGQRAIP